MNKIIAAVALLAMPGCASTKDFIGRHPVITTIALTSVMLSAPTWIHHDNSGTKGTDGRIGLPLVPDCNAYPEMCK